MLCAPVCTAKLPKSAQLVLPLQVTLYVLVIWVSSDTPTTPPTMAIGKAAKWISFATPQQTPTSSSVAHDTLHTTISIADQKQFGLENVRDSHLRPHSPLLTLTSLVLLPVSLEIPGASSCACALVLSVPFSSVSNQH